MLRELEDGMRQKISRHKDQGKSKMDARSGAAEEDERPGKKSALECFCHDFIALAVVGALPPLIGRREEMLKITQILLQRRKNNLILVGEPGVGKTDGVKAETLRF